MEPLLRAISEAKTIVLVSHIKPDGDAVGAVQGLAQALTIYGKQVTAVLFDEVPAVFSYLKGPIVHELPDDADLCILLDASSGSRTGFLQTITHYEQQQKLAVIDHHPKVELAKTVQMYLYRLEASSASELVLELVQALGIKLTGSLCTSLLTGLYTDTGGFEFSNTTPRCLEAAAELLRRGGNLQTITRALEANRTLTGLKLLGIALERARSCARGTVTYLLHSDFQRLQASDEELHGIVNQIDHLPNSQFALLLTEHDLGVVRGNLRGGEGSININGLARLLNGGGHAKAAGFSFPGHLVESDNWVRVDELA